MYRTRVRPRTGRFRRWTPRIKPTKHGVSSKQKTTSFGNSLAHVNATVQDNIVEEAHATMVFQNVGLKKMKEALHQQEEKTMTDRAHLFKGKAQVLSDTEFTNHVKEINVVKRVKEAGKEAKKAARQHEDLEKEWAQMKLRHAAEVEAWSLTCSELLNAGTKKKDLPPKPKLGLKPQLPVEEDVEEDEEDEVGDEMMGEADV
ncbi:hypothetical protein DFH06DRAFT_1130547 [Mycena polygramma]|nr:hypothetical protein DFH06DRAFT_1130547 [Mycena polygramma]